MKGLHGVASFAGDGAGLRMAWHGTKMASVR